MANTTSSLNANVSCTNCYYSYTATCTSTGNKPKCNSTSMVKPSWLGYMLLLITLLPIIFVY